MQSQVHCTARQIQVKRGTAKYSAEKIHYVLYIQKVAFDDNIKYDTERSQVDHKQTTSRPLLRPLKISEGQEIK